jgi:hypothetical protein
MLCLTVVPLPPGKNPFAVKIIITIMIIIMIIIIIIIIQPERLTIFGKQKQKWEGSIEVNFNEKRRENKIGIQLARSCGERQRNSEFHKRRLIS